MNTLQRDNSDWRLARCGKITASRAADVIAKTKTGYGASRANYMAELLIERLTGCPTESFQSPAMQWGIEQEPFAKVAYAAFTGELVEDVGFIPHPSLLEAGASPDGKVLDGLVEIKCPASATHLDTLLTESIAQKYITQMQFQMACTQTQWCDFVSYDGRMPEHLQLFVKRVARDDAYIAMLETEITAFDKELTEKLAKLEERKNG